MALYQSGKRISGIRDFPAYTWAAYHALPVAKRPKVWKCTDRDYTEIPPEKVSVFGNGVKTYGQLLAELQALIDYSKINPKSALDIDHGWYSIEFAYNRILESYRVRSGGSATMVFEIYLSDNECTYKGRNAESGTTTNYSSATVANGAVFSLIY